MPSIKIDGSNFTCYMLKYVSLYIIELVLIKEIVLIIIKELDI